MNKIKNQEFEQIKKAIKLIHNQIKWKQNKAQTHLIKRIKLGHLADNSSLNDYEKLIKIIIFNLESEVYIFREESTFYPTITNKIQDKLWLVMFSLEGIMETAFPPHNPEKYLKNNPFFYIGKLQEFV